MTKNRILQGLGVVAVLALVYWVAHVGGSRSTVSLFGANQCASGQTCLPSLELTGPNSGVTNALQLDSGIFNNAGTLTQSGASTFSGAVALTSTFQLGSSGTAQSLQLSGTCAIAGPVSQAASTTKEYSCAAPGAVSGDRVIAQFASSTQAWGNWSIATARASTTADFITFGVVNNTGAAGTPNFGAVGSTTYWLDR